MSRAAPAGPGPARSPPVEARDASRSRPSRWPSRWPEPSRRDRAARRGLYLFRSVGAGGSEGRDVTAATSTPRRRGAEIIAARRFGERPSVAVARELGRVPGAASIGSTACSAPTRPARCAPSDAGTPSPSPAGWPAGAITAAWPSSTCATRPGIVQVVVRDEEVAHGLRNEYCVRVDRRGAAPPGGQREPGRCRPARSRSSRDAVEVLTPPRRCRSRSTSTSAVGEEVALKYRYLDLRRPGPAAALRLRARSTGRPARCCTTRGFVEVETPTLTRSTPEGARDFLVPARLQPGSWYALPQCAAAVQAAADGRRARALLPDRPLLPRRGLPRRPAAGVHPARHRDELRRAGRRHRARRGRRPRAVESCRRTSVSRRSRG